MKTLFRNLLCGMLGLAGTVLSPAAQPSGDWVPLKINQTTTPLYPLSLILTAVKLGEARVAFSVDATGKLEDLLVVAYTHPDFAQSSVRALKEWTFEPARLRGEPVGVSTEITVKFELEGMVIVSMTAADTMTARFQAINDLANSYRPRLLPELDRIPTPISAPAPAYPQALAQQGRKAVVNVEFFIDETGAVRLPSVTSAEDAVLAPLAIEALRQWKFEPPTCHGRPVLVKARQAFHFGAEKKAPAPASGGDR